MSLCERQPPELSPKSSSPLHGLWTDMHPSYGSSTSRAFFPPTTNTASVNFDLRGNAGTLNGMSHDNSLTTLNLHLPPSGPLRPSTYVFEDRPRSTTAAALTMLNMNLATNGSGQGYGEDGGANSDGSLGHVHGVLGSSGNRGRGGNGGGRRDDGAYGDGDDDEERRNREAAVDRKRIAVACGRCRKRKIRCSGDTGDGQPCTNCQSAGHTPCQFLRVSSREIDVPTSANYTYSVEASRRARARVTAHSSLSEPRTSTQYDASLYSTSDNHVLPTANMSYRPSHCSPPYEYVGNRYVGNRYWPAPATTEHTYTGDVAYAGGGGLNNEVYSNSRVWNIPHRPGMNIKTDGWYVSDASISGLGNAAGALGDYAAAANATTTLAHRPAAVSYATSGAEVSMSYGHGTISHQGLVSGELAAEMPGSGGHIDSASHRRAQQQSQRYGEASGCGDGLHGIQSPQYSYAPGYTTMNTLPTANVSTHWPPNAESTVLGGSASSDAHSSPAQLSRSGSTSEIVAAATTLAFASQSASAPPVSSKESVDTSTERHDAQGSLSRAFDWSTVKWDEAAGKYRHALPDTTGGGSRSERMRSSGRGDRPEAKI